MNLSSEHSILTPVGEPSIYITGDDDPESPDIRICFVTPNMNVWHDMTPKRLAELGEMIRDALHDEGYCEHGVNTADGEWCHGCAMTAETDEPVPMSTCRNCCCRFESNPISPHLCEACQAGRGT